MLSFPPTLYIQYVEIQAWHLKNIFFGFYLTKFTMLQDNYKMTNGEYIYRKIIDCMSRMALEKTILEGFQ